MLQELNGSHHSAVRASYRNISLIRELQPVSKMLFLILTAAATYTVLLIAGAAFTLTCLGNIGFTKTVGKA